MARLRCCEQAEQERKQPSQPGPEQPHVVPCRCEDGVGSVTLCPEQEVAAEQAVGLHVADDRLDGVAPPPLASDGRRVAVSA
jgi:hypothetical protein